MNKEHDEKRIAVSKEMDIHYEKIFASLFNECINKLPEELDLICMTFGVDKTKLTMDACRRTLKKYEDATKTKESS